MARYRIVHWREIPSLVEAFEDDQVARVLLSQRFQDLIDAVAMRQGASDTDAYLEGWGQSADLEQPGSVEDVAGQVAARLEAEFQDVVARRLPPPSR
jgi:cvfA/B/C family virulence factor